MSLAPDLARVGLDAAWADCHGNIELLIKPIGADRAYAVILDPTAPFEVRAALADNIARRLNLDSSLLPQR